MSITDYLIIVVSALPGEFHSSMGQLDVRYSRAFPKKASALVLDKVIVVINKVDYDNSTNWILPSYHNLVDELGGG